MDIQHQLGVVHKTYESVQRVLFLFTPSPSPKAYSKMLIFFQIHDHWISGHNISAPSLNIEKGKKAGC